MSLFKRVSQRKEKILRIPHLVAFEELVSNEKKILIVQTRSFCLYMENYKYILLEK